MTDLAKHLFEMGVAMNRVAAEAHGAGPHVVDLADTELAREQAHDEHRNDPWWCPPEIVESLLRYWHQRIPTGGFLEAVLCNDLRDACGRADDTNIRHLPGIVQFCYWQLPGGSWGSPERVNAWLAREDEAQKATT